MPGVCSYAAIRDNHSMMLAPTARAGVLEGNPVREDIDEAGGIVGVDFLFNVVLDEHKHILHAVAGHYLEAHRAGVRLYDARCDLTVPQAADVVIASPGGRPKDINLYQAQKTLDNVAGAVRDGGVVILVARCPRASDRLRSRSGCAAWASPQVLIDRIQREFVLGGHKAAAIAGLLARVDVYLVSEFPAEVVRSMCMTPFDSVDGAVQAALARARSRRPLPRGAARQPRHGTAGADPGVAPRLSARWFVEIDQIAGKYWSAVVTVWHGPHTACRKGRRTLVVTATVPYICCTNYTSGGTRYEHEADSASR